MVSGCKKSELLHIRSMYINNCYENYNHFHGKSWIFNNRTSKLQDRRNEACCFSQAASEKRRSWRFRKIYWKTPVLKSLFNKIAGILTCNYIKKETSGQVFSCEFSEIFKNTFFTEHLRATASGYQLNSRKFPEKKHLKKVLF